MITIKNFEKAIKQFDKRESRTNFFLLAQNLMKNGFEVEAMLLILSTWNFATFRYAVKSFDVLNFKKVIKSLEANFEKLEGKKFLKVDYDAHVKDLKTIFQSLSKINGVGYTGAPKIMHLKNPDLFVMWDGFIRGEKPTKYYSQL